MFKIECNNDFKFDFIHYLVTFFIELFFQCEMELIKTVLLLIYGCKFFILGNSKFKI